MLEDTMFQYLGLTNNWDTEIQHMGLSHFHY